MDETWGLQSFSPSLSKFIFSWPYASFLPHFYFKTIIFDISQVLQSNVIDHTHSLWPQNHVMSLLFQYRAENLQLTLLLYTLSVPAKIIYTKKNGFHNRKLITWSTIAKGLLFIFGDYCPWFYFLWPWCLIGNLRSNGYCIGTSSNRSIYQFTYFVASNLPGIVLCFMK